MVLRISGQDDVPCNRCWRLNERMYGGLTGLNKVETAEKYGDEQVKIWRRSFDTPPPEVDLDSEWYPGNDAEYLHIPMEDIPRAESLKDCIDRTLPYWQSDITPALKRGKTVLSRRTATRSAACSSTSMASRTTRSSTSRCP